MERKKTERNRIEKKTESKKKEDEEGRNKEEKEYRIKRRRESGNTVVYSVHCAVRQGHSMVEAQDSD